MQKFLVCKTIVAHPGRAQFVLFFLENGWRLFDSVSELADFMGGGTLDSRDENFIKNEAPVDIIREVATGTVRELERLSKDEVRELARLLRK